MGSVNGLDRSMKRRAIMAIEVEAVEMPNVWQLEVDEGMEDREEEPLEAMQT
jgi:hypothetical protein